MNFEGKTRAEVHVEVFYDGGCPLCTAEIGHYRRRDRAQTLGFTNISASCTRLPEGVSRQEALARFHVRTADGRVLSGAAAFVEVWRHLRGWRWLAQLTRLPGVLWGMEHSYQLFLRLRPAVVRAFAALKRKRV